MAWYSPFSAVRAQLLHSCEPPRTIKYSEDVRLWPILLPALVTLCTIGALIIYTNYNSSVCSDQLRLQYWMGPQEAEAAGCSVLESIPEDWSSYAVRAVMDRIHIMRMYTGFPFFEGTTKYEQLWTPTADDCKNDMLNTPIAYPVVYIDLHHYDTTGTMGITMEAETQWPQITLLVSIRSQINSSYWSYLSAPGFVELSNSPYVPGKSSIINSTWGTNSTYSKNAVVLFFNNLHAQVQLFFFNACRDFVLRKHLHSCHICVGDSAVSISWIIIIGFIQAASVITRISVWLIRRCNRQYQLPPSDAEEMPRSQMHDDFRENLLCSNGHIALV